MIRKNNIKRIIISVLTCALMVLSLAGCTGGSGAGGSVSGSGVKIFYTTPVLDDFKGLLLNAIKDSDHNTELQSRLEQSARASMNRLNRCVKQLLPGTT